MILYSCIALRFISHILLRIDVLTVNKCIPLFYAAETPITADSGIEVKTNSDTVLSRNSHMLQTPNVLEKDNSLHSVQSEVT